MADNPEIVPGIPVAADDVGGVFYQRIKPTFGADGVAVDAAIDVGDPGAGVQRVVAANITQKLADQTVTRPNNATPYTAGDTIANSATAGSVTKMSWTIPGGSATFVQFRVRKSDQTVFTPTIRVYLFDADPTVGAGDNLAFSGNPLAGCIGIVDVDVTTPGSDDAVGWEPCNIAVDATTVYGLLATQSGFTPAANEVFTVTPWVAQG